MRISQFIRDVLIRSQLNEANETDNPAAKNTRAKAKPQGDQKRAHSKEEKVQQKPGEVKQQVSGGKGQGQEGGQVKRQVQQADKKRDRVGDAEKASTTMGTMNPMRNYASGSAAEVAADKQAASYGEFDQNRKDRTKDNVKPKWTGDRDRWSDGEFASGPKEDDIPTTPKAYTDDDGVTYDFFQLPGETKVTKKPYYPQEMIAKRRAMGGDQAAIADGMERQNAEFAKLAKSRKEKHDAENKKLRDQNKKIADQGGTKKASRDSFSEEEKEMAADALRIVKHAGRLDAQQVRNLLKNKFGLDDNGVKRLLFVMRDVHSKKMKGLSGEHRDDLSDEDIERGSAKVATGGRRGSLEVKDMTRRANTDAAIKDMSPEEIDQLAVKAGQGDKEAQEIIFKKTARMLMQAASKYSGGNDANMADMYSEAKVALMQAFKTYDPSKGAKFSTWLYKVVNGLVRNASYADRNIRVPGKKADEIAKMREFQRQAEQQGLTGHDIDMYVIDKMGLKTWQDLDKLKQAASVGGTASMSTPVGDEDDGGTLGDTLGDTSIGSEYHSGETQSIGTGAAPDTELDNMQKELATQDPTMSKELMNALYDRGNVAPEAREIINSMFGIGGEEPMTDSEIGAVYGVTNYQLKKIMDTALLGMAMAIAQEQGTSPEEEMQNLAKILRTRKLDYRASKMGRSYDADDERSPEQVADDERLAAERNAVRTGRRDFKKRNA